ncbi:NAD(P)H-binding protein [Streptomyces sp. NBC_01334]|uniref:NAD(P)H-binding protein n=1 Tax=Streptomyces sp. NBC_01334 TaxID=2903827 RepID=UPI002E14CFD1|nr:NAD(P)H-binding protein [Streptomyces sp. NBC_01334]WSN45188.1 NAD(P)H-binding protein [Streptomyces sp. NBC_01334]
MILVTGATGTVGREVVGRLPAGAGVRVMARDPAKVRGVAAGVERVAGDYGDPGSLARALRGVRTAFLVTARVAGADDEVFVAAARAAGVRRVVKLSAAAVLDEGAGDLITRWQRESEELLRASGMEWTLLRPRAFMSNSLSWAGSVRGEGVVRALYGEAAHACVDPADVARAAVRVLTEEGHAGRAYTLTGPQALSAVEQTRQLGALLGVELRFEELSPGQARAALAGRFPPAVVEALLDSAQRLKAGAKAGVQDTVSRLTGRPARTFRQWAAAHVASFGAVTAAAGPRTPEAGPRASGAGAGGTDAAP